MGCVFITGATGLVGTALIEYLDDVRPFSVKDRKDIVCFVRNPSKAKRLSVLGYSVFIGDLGSKESLMEAFRTYRPGIVFHLAAEVDVNSSYEKMYRVNVEGLKNVLDAFVQSDAEIFVYSSSVIVYDHNLGQYPQHIYREDDPMGSSMPGDDVPYAITKRLGELLIKQYIHDYPQKSFIITRLSGIVGKADRQFAPTLYRAGKMRGPKLIGGGKTRLSLVSSLDVARAMVFLAENSQISRNRVFNVSCRALSYREIFEIVSEYLGEKPPKASIPVSLFKLLVPFIKFAILFVKKGSFLRTYFSKTSLRYLLNTYIYSSERIKGLGFEFAKDPAEAIRESLAYLENQKKMREIN